MQGIYCIENLQNGKKYIGSAENIEKRFKRHQHDLKNGKHHNIHLQRSYDKYGEECFSYYVVEDTDDLTYEELLMLEQEYIDINIGGYNMAPAGGGDILSSHPNKEEIYVRTRNTLRKKISLMSEEERREKWGKFGKYNHNWRNGGVSKKLCPQCENVWIASSYNTCGGCRDMTGERNPFYGKHHTDETKERLRNAMRESCWTIGKTPEEIPYTKKYEISYVGGRTLTVFGLEEIANMFDTSIANVAMTIKRMKKVAPTKRSRFYGVIIKEVGR